MLRLILCVPLLTIICSCGPTDINGHWHLDEGRFSAHPVLVDIVNDTLVLLGQRLPLDAGRTGYHDGYAQTLQTPLECGIGNWRYEKVTERTLKLFDNNDDHFLGYLQRRDHCDFQEDLFGRCKLQVSLPASEGKCTSLPPSLLKMPIYIGYTKPAYTTYSAGYKISLGDRIDQDTSSLALYAEQAKERLPESRRHRLHPVIFADADAPDSLTSRVLDYYRRAGEPGAYLARLNQENAGQLCFDPVIFTATTNRPANQ